MKENQFTVYKWLNAVTFVMMVTVNALANILPINGIGTGAVSDAYPNLFAPAGLTFAIWGVIYLLLAGFVVYQLGFIKAKNVDRVAAIKRIGLYFMISSLANTVWVFSWHYQIIPLSLMLMLVILISLILAYNGINKASLTFSEKILIRLPFGVYFGWITVATIANVTTFLVSISWNGFGLSQSVWTIVAVIAGLFISIATIWKNKDIAYGLVILWAYAGILNKHLMATGFAGKYPEIIATVAISMAVILIIVVVSGIKLERTRKA